ncbi:MAG: hypothetical protein A3J83_09060 [Elusimicrobia bacterium RIFOXYA2_FULL_40_6]|nr:MAG: hypothetical protein A3J83_09060 [Elusimicrobia bacterium RIFOXYA2_FULL_40_6]
MIQTKNIYKGRDFKWPTHTNSLLLDRKHAAGTEVFLTTIQPGKFTHSHIHNDNEQLYYVIEGAGKIVFFKKGQQNKKKTIAVNKEEIVFIPLKIEHQVFCFGKKPLRYLTIDIFPKGKPKDEPTWAAHARNLKRDTKK